MFMIMPVCIFGCFWIGFQLDSLLRIHIFKMIFPVAGSVIGLFFTGLLILLGHARESATGVIGDLKKQSSCESLQKQIESRKESSPKAPRTKPGYLTAFQDN